MAHYSQRISVNQVVLLLFDILIICGCFRTISYLQRGDWQFSGDYPMFFAVFVLLWWIVAERMANPNPPGRLTTYVEKFWNVFTAFLVHAIGITTGMVLLQNHIMPFRYLLLLYLIIGIGVVGWRLAMACFYRVYRYRLAQPHSRFIIVGDSRRGRELQQFIDERHPLTNQFLGFFADTTPSKAVEHLVRGGLADLKEFCVREQVDQIYFALPLDQTNLIQELSSFADDHFMAFRIVPDFEGTLQKNVTVYYYDHGPIITIRRQPLAFRPNQIVKRVFDLAFSGLVIVGIFPFIIPVLALLIKLDSPGPVFFKQMRPGKHNKLFPCYKFRTMRRELSGRELQATKGDTRVTRIGSFLRASSLDELPQFFNVWLGHMSVVGPRPNMVSQLEEYSKHIRTYAQRHAVTPGITGYAQVNGFRGETRAEGAMEKRVQYDLEYVENWSLLFDVKIIGKTVWNMIHGEKNAY